MKLDRLKFAKLIGFITSQVGSMTDWVISDLDDMIDVDLPAQKVVGANASDVDELLRQLNAPDGFIPAIKAYRVLTGAGLKESKEAIERYRIVPKFPKKDEPASEFKVDPKAATLGYILDIAKKVQF